MNDFERICKLLEDNKTVAHCGGNRYIYTKTEVKKFVGKDIDKLLLLKSEAQGGNFIEYSSLILSMTAMTISIVSVLASLLFSVYSESISSTINVMYFLICVIIVVLTLVLYVKTSNALKKYMYIYRWRKYVLVAVEELEKQFK